MKIKFGSAVFWRIFLAMLAFALIPTLVLGWLAIRSGQQAGQVSIDLSREALDKKSQEALELRAEVTAMAIARFLTERETDLHVFSELPIDEGAYLRFNHAHQSELWYTEEGQEQRDNVPLYVEVAFIAPDGQEIIKIAEGHVAGAGELKDVSDKKNTLYRSETYFNEAVRLSEGEVYVGSLTGYFIKKEAYEAGERFRGVIRFAKPVFDADGAFTGVVVLTLDHRHIQEFTSHIMPTEDRFVVEPDPASGNYAYLIDSRAWTLAHPNEYFIVGLDPNGGQLPYVSAPDELGSLPVRLDQIGFLDENLAGIHAKASQGLAGSIQYRWQEKDKFVAFAPIPYYGGMYQQPGGFGWVGIGAEVNTFHKEATLVGSAITDSVDTLLVIIAIVLIFGSLITLPTAVMVARGIASPIQRITQAARRVEQENFDLSVLDPLLTHESKDEITVLARVFKQMSDQVHKRETQLKNTIQRLQIEINEVKKAEALAEVTETEYFQIIQQKAKELKKSKGDKS